MLRAFAGVVAIYLVLWAVFTAADSYALRKRDPRGFYE